jgi:hydrogenase nickel incorporation protein HypA/HybF
MHELAVAESIVAAVEEKVLPRRVACVRLQIGELSGVVTEALRFCFDLCTEGTALEGAALEIDEVHGRARCRCCGNELSIDSLLDLCPCGTADLELLAGQELRIKEVEVH